MSEEESKGISINDFLESGVFKAMNPEGANFSKSKPIAPKTPTSQRTASKIKFKKTNFKDDPFSGLNLFKFNDEELPKLIDPIFPKVGLVSLVGSSDTGKSTILRQLALSVALGLDNFLGYKIDTKTRNVIYISTEDDSTSTSISLKRQIKGLKTFNEFPDESLNHLKFIFDFNFTSNDDDNLFKKLENDLSTHGADLIIIDAFTDIFSGDINSSTKVREFLNTFSTLSKKHNTLILFLHHTGKRTDKFTASKDNVLGSQAFEAKMRVLLELKLVPNNDEKRTLTITKGNYISTKIKKYSKLLKFDESSLLFHFEKDLLTSELLNNSKTYGKKDEVKPIIKKLHEEKKSLRAIETTVKELGYQVGKSTIANYLKEFKSS